MRTNFYITLVTRSLACHFMPSSDNVFTALADAVQWRGRNSLFALLPHHPHGDPLEMNGDPPPTDRPAPSPGYPTDVPVPEPHDVPAWEPVDDPPPDVDDPQPKPRPIP